MSILDDHVKFSRSTGVVKEYFVVNEGHLLNFLPWWVSPRYVLLGSLCTIQ